MNIFITGVSGFAGYTLVRHFNGKESFTMFGHSRNILKTKAKYKDVDIALVDSYSAQQFNDLKIDCVIHLAGIAHDLSGQYKEEDYVKVNFEGTKEIYDQFLESSATQFIFVSSIKAAVDQAENAVDENVAPRPQTPYGRSKRKAEEFILSQDLPSTKRFYILRPCMIHGPQNKGNLNLLYRYVKSGLPYPLGSFQNQRSFLSADNFSFYIERILTRGIPSGIYNLSDTGTLSTCDVVRLIARAMDRRARIWHVPGKLVQLGAAVLGKRMLSKLTENMIVPNDKIISSINDSPPLSLDEGIVKTIRSFHE